jgi:shikimate dehydrogenase
MPITGTTRIVGIFGDPVAHSLSPRMHNAALTAAGIDAVYVPFHVAPPRLPAAVQAIRALGMVGVNLTIPHKEAACALVDELDPMAAAVGAVNTIVNRAGHLCGYNTDTVGLLRALERELATTVAGRRVLVFGAGGAARAALVALAQAGAAWIGVANRTVARAEQLLTEIAPRWPATAFAALPLVAAELLKGGAGGVDLLVNSSALGLHGEGCDLPLARLVRGGGAVYDMVYGAAATPLVKAATAAGLTAADGRGMLAGQGEAAFALWFAVDPPQGVMRAAVAAGSAE